MAEVKIQFSTEIAKKTKKQNKNKNKQKKKHCFLAAAILPFIGKIIITW